MMSGHGYAFSMTYGQPAGHDVRSLPVAAAFPRPVRLPDGLAGSV
jgi:hypothetical protein